MVTNNFETQIHLEGLWRTKENLR